MSSAAGTNITTYNATYMPPKFMPGYNGHVPTMKFDYGETYGNGTAKYFQDHRIHTQGTSRENTFAGGYLASPYSCTPSLAIESRTRTWDRWVQAPNYRLTHQDHDRREELINFTQKSLAHRENYLDKSGTVPRVNQFLLNTPVERQFTKSIL